jgi:hypothetical protein
LLCVLNDQASQLSEVAHFAFQIIRLQSYQKQLAFCFK